MPAFYPSVVVDLRLTFDEAYHLITYPTPVSVDESVQRSAAPARLTTEPLFTQSGVSRVVGRVPLKADIQLPGYRQAGQFSFELNFIDLPIDPRTVRSCACDIFLGTVEAANFARGMRGAEPNGSLASVISPSTPTQNNLLMTGIVDKWSVSHGEDGSKVSFSGRDMRGVLLDTPVSVISRDLNQVVSLLDLTKPIDQVVKQLLSFVDAFQQFEVVVNPAEWANNYVPSPALQAEVPRHRRGARGNQARANPPSGSTDLKFWDLIVRYCYLVGAIPYFQGLQLYIRPSRTIFDQARGPIDPVRNPTPFAGGLPRTEDGVSRTPLAQPLTYRRLVYGRDIKELSFERNIGGARRPYVVRCVSMDASSATRGNERVLQAFWPPENANAQAQEARTTRVAPSGAQAQQEVLTIPVAGINSIERLQQIARATYEEIGRGEMGGTCSLQNVTSFGGSNTDPDMLRLKPGDGVEFAVDVRTQGTGHPLLAPLIDAQRTSFDQQVARVAARIGDENLARVVVATTRGQVQELQSFFRVQNVKYSWDPSSGIKVDFDFQNYVVPRNQIEDANPASGAATRLTVPARRRITL